MTQRTKTGAKPSKASGIPEQTQKVIAVVLVVAVIFFVAFMAKTMGFWPGQGSDVPPKRLVLTPQQIQELRAQRLGATASEAKANATPGNGNGQ